MADSGELSPNNDSPRGDGYIAARKHELAAALLTEASSGAERATQLADVLKLLGAILHYEAFDVSERLKALYDPLDPDAPAARRDSSPEAYDAFAAAFSAALESANFTEIEAHSVQAAEATKHITGLKIKPSQAGIRSIRYFARGIRPETIKVKRLFGTHTIETHMMADVIVLVGFKGDSEIVKDDRRAFAHLRRGVRPGAALIKHFRNVATPELVTLHPGARPSMRPRDQIMLAGPAVAAGVPVILNLWPALTILFAVLAAYFGARGVIEESELKRALAAVSGLVAVGAFVMRQRLKYEAQTLRYQKRLADTVYFRNLANNAGVIDLVIGAAEEQDAKEAFLAYSLLLNANRAMTRAELDAEAEAFLQRALKLKLDFDITDALKKLERLNLAAKEGDAYRAVPAPDALAHLDLAWDSAFSFTMPAS